MVGCPLRDDGRLTVLMELVPEQEPHVDGSEQHQHQNGQQQSELGDRLRPACSHSSRPGVVVEPANSRDQGLDTRGRRHVLHRVVRARR